MVKISHTFMFADLTGFSEYTERHGEERAAELAVSFHRWAGELAQLEGVELVKGIGDAVMLHAHDPRAALRLAHRLTIAAEPAGFPPLRIGLDMGPAIELGGDWYGSAVNNAARVVAKAAGGDLLMTERMRQAVPA
jgi:adenylate cyclase